MASPSLASPRHLNQHFHKLTQNSLAYWQRYLDKHPDSDEQAGLNQEWVGMVKTLEMALRVCAQAGRGAGGQGGRGAREQVDLLAKNQLPLKRVGIEAPLPSREEASFKQEGRGEGESLNPSHPAFTNLSVLSPRTERGLMLANEPNLPPHLWPQTLSLIEGLTRYMESQQWQSWQSLLKEAIAQAQMYGDGPAEVNLSLILTRLLRRQGNYLDIVASYRRLIALSRRLGDMYNEARACTNLGYFYIDWHHWWRTETLCCYALEIFEDLENNHGLAHSHNNLGVLYTRQQRWLEAEEHLDKACAIWRERKDIYGLTHGFINLGVLNKEKQDYPSALTSYQLALDYARQTNNEGAIGDCYLNLGECYHRLKQLTKAESYIKIANDFFRRMDDARSLAKVWDTLALIYIDLGHWLQAEAYLHKATLTWTELDSNPDKIRMKLYEFEYTLAKEKSQLSKEEKTQLETLVKQYQPYLSLAQLPYRIKAILVT